MSEETAARAPAGDPTPDKGIPEEGVQPRGKWAKKWEFIFSLAGEIQPWKCFAFPPFMLQKWRR